ncbi:MAG: 3-phosphoshikimate 1-carboxyvinyltransferase [Lachnospiraceae bacterium]|jgi:3-phosphoshikimate 1-carboxyvinyltransferase|nr:3-phosphoshikimate 1-carboxyvinyltransferase [Lachnospiraceae bacterium]MCH4064488.1 3-phosphoshikimate 1-carboxyvinyltransferase [Lachnospiraceae bacterium]MCH4104719.1 3-phosphoshikimate 1-carboxyvinyltransferase [Lachnospiraceae bacterium]MCI1308638.1 3-phosphoshikimate 1-carboxyvinyltransferase [Lachnospiraceae bacterium]MCI1333307.1 3-phosphoshikimate 1-carboxyvinyltransferase [Lachnospiraceae bacterium]
MHISNVSALHGTITVPGDKSISHRSVMLGAISEGSTYVRGFLKSADCLATIDCFRRLGVDIREIENGSHFQDADPGEPVLVIYGAGLHGLKDAGSAPLDAKNSGTTVRLMSGILAGQPFISHLTGDSSLQKRPMARIIRPLGEMGISVVSDRGNNCVPLTINGGKPKGIHYESPIASAQVKSCVLLAGLYADDPTFFTEPFLSRNHTELMLQSFGGNLKARKRSGSDAVTTILYPNTILRGQDVRVPGDISSAAYFLAAALLVPGSEVTLRNVGINTTRDGILRVIRAMGGDMELGNVRMEGREPVADITVRFSQLHGTEIGGALIPTLIDEIPVIAVMAAAADGVTTIRDAAELKVKESDRLHEIVTDLRLMGITVEETDDGMIITGGRLRSAKIDPKGDHRLAMAFAVAGLIARDGVDIENSECVSVSYPEFFHDLYSLS